jgi:hypothetical protein
MTRRKKRTACPSLFSSSRVTCVIVFTLACVVWQTLPAVAQQLTLVAPGNRQVPTSADGRLVVLTVRSAQVPDDTNNWDDVYVYDTQAGTYDLVSIGMHGERIINDFTGGTSGVGISPDGRFVLFQTTSALDPRSAATANRFYTPTSMRIRVAATPPVPDLANVRSPR